ncbi:hypothetical protein Fot_06099 [Forsythia ovata]|uniref:Uncharacterized protein n=1 Tax=Forsythia ovata TaxID=205694 RepID=A0ABD1WS03_9LAMI
MREMRFTILTFQYQHQGYNMEKNYGNPNFSPRYSQEPETSQASIMFNRLRGSHLRNMRERRTATVASQAPHISPPHQYQPTHVEMPSTGRPVQDLGEGIRHIQQV